MTLTFVRMPRGHCSLPALGSQAVPGARPSPGGTPGNSCSPRRTSTRPGLCAEHAAPQEGPGFAGPHTGHPPHVTRGAHALLARLQAPQGRCSGTHPRQHPRPPRPGQPRPRPAEPGPEGSDPQTVRPERAGSGLCLSARPAGKCSPQRRNLVEPSRLSGL